jgi:tetratricopeptide (TPR) repeat protein
VGALSKPEPEPVVEPAAPEPAEAEGWALLEGLRRRLDDQVVQGRKTQQQVTQLAESIGALVDIQRRRSRWLNLNSFVAYLIFTVLCGAGFYFVYSTRAHELSSGRDTARKERDAAVRRADEATAKLAAREQAEARAWEVYELLEANKRAEATKKLDELAALPLSKTERAILAARAHEVQVMEVDAALKSAAAAFKAGRHGDVIASLEAALVGEPAGARASAMHYFLGVAYAKTAQLDKAITHLTDALAVEADHEDVRFQLASALDRSGQYAKARVEYDRFATAHPTSTFTPFAWRRSATLARMPAVAPKLPATVPSPTTTSPGAATPPPAAGQMPRAPMKPAAPKPAAPNPPAPPAEGDESKTEPAAPTSPPPSPSSPSPTTQMQPMGAAGSISTSTSGSMSTSISTSGGSTELTPIPPSEPPPASMPVPTPQPAQPSPPERITPGPEVTATPPPPPAPPAPPPTERVAAE